MFYNHAAYREHDRREYWHMPSRPSLWSLLVLVRPSGIYANRIQFLGASRPSTATCSQMTLLEDQGAFAYAETHEALSTGSRA